MAIRQYIGARYVPKFYENSLGTAEWSAGVIYEALTIVTYNNNSYTSKKTVPASVGDPSSNPEYWVATGAYNSQISALSTRVDAMEPVVNAYAGPPVNILTLGAKNDGSEDVSSIINTYSAMYSLYIPIGVYRLDAPCTIRHNILGAVSAIGGESVIFDAHHAGSVFTVDPSTALDEITIRDIKIEGNNIATVGIDYRAGIQGFIDIDSVDIAHIMGSAIYIRPTFSTSRCARINNVIVRGPSDYSSFVGTDYSDIVGIKMNNSCNDSEITNIQLMWINRGIQTESGIRAENVHIYCAAYNAGPAYLPSDITAYYNTTIGIDAQVVFFGSDIYIDTALQAYIQRSGCGSISNFTYWDDGFFASTGVTTAVLVSTRNLARVFINGMIAGGNPTNMQRITSDFGSNVRIEHLQNLFWASYFTDINNADGRKFGLIGFNANDYTVRFAYSGLTANYYSECARVYVPNGGMIEISLGFGSNITKISILHSGGNWTVTKISDRFSQGIGYKTAGNYIMFFAQHSGTSIDGSADLISSGGGVCGICETVPCVNYPREELADASTLTILT